MEELSKVFLKDPQDAIIITDGKGFSESENIINALLGVPQYQLGMGISLVKQRNLGEKIIELLYVERRDGEMQE